MCVSWFGPSVARDSRNAGPLAVIVPLLEAIGIEDILHRHVPQGARQEFPDAKVLTALLAARLCQPTALDNVAQWARDTGAEFLLGIPADKLNDDRLGRALDHFFEHRYSVLGSVAAKVAHDFNIPLEHLHFDPTHITFTGAYDSSVSRRDALPLPPETPLADFPPAHITHGYASKLRLVHVGVTAAIDSFGAVPLFANPVAGNQNGHTTIAEAFHLLEEYLPLPERLLMISDRGTYSAPHVARLHHAGHHVLCSAPWDEFKKLYDQHQADLDWLDARFFSIEQQRRRDTPSSRPQEHYEIASIKHQVRDPDSQDPIDARVLFAYSTAQEKIEGETRRQNVAKIRQGLEALALAVARNHRATRLDKIPQRVAHLLGKKSAAQFFTWQLTPLSDAEKDVLPPPGVNCSKPTHRLVFHLDEQAVQDDARYDGLSVLVTTAPLTYTTDRLFTQFKMQCHLEQSHHQYKTPLAVSPVFLKNPRRVETLVILLQVALTAYHLIQRRYRMQASADASLTDRRMTTETILRAFQNYPLVIDRVPGGQIIRATHATALQRQFLNQLGFASLDQILRRNLPAHPPD